jgi:hypothetical protein
MVAAYALTSLTSGDEPPGNPGVFVQGLVATSEVCTGVV